MQFTCWIVSKQYSAVHKILQILHVSFSFSLDLALSSIDDEEDKPITFIPDCVPSFNIFWIWKFCMRLVAAPWILEYDDELTLLNLIRENSWIIKWIQIIRD